MGSSSWNFISQNGQGKRIDKTEDLNCNVFIHQPGNTFSHARLQPFTEAPRILQLLTKRKSLFLIFATLLLCLCLSSLLLPLVRGRLKAVALTARWSPWRVECSVSSAAFAISDSSPCKGLLPGVDSGTPVVQWALRQSGCDVVEAHLWLIDQQMQHWCARARAAAVDGVSTLFNETDVAQQQAEYEELAELTPTGVLKAGPKWRGMALNNHSAWILEQVWEAVVKATGPPGVRGVPLIFNGADDPMSTDKSSAPVFSFCKWKGTHDLLIPYALLLYKHECEPEDPACWVRRDIRAGPSDPRKPTAVLRVSPGGLGGWPKGRQAMCDTSLEHPDYVDAGIIALNEHDEQTLVQFNITRYRKGYLTYKEQADTYRYAIHVLGNCGSARLWGYMLSDMLVFRVLHPRGDEEWYYRLLQPWVHYVPVYLNGTGSDILEKIEWARRNPEQVRKIVSQAQALVFKHVAGLARDTYMALLLNAYGHALHGAKFSRGAFRGAEAARHRNFSSSSASDSSNSSAAKRTARGQQSVRALSSSRQILRSRLG